MRSKKYTDEQFKAAVISNKSIRGVLRDLNLSPAGGNYKTIHLIVKKLNLDISHWTGQGHLKGKQNPWVKKIPTENILVENSLYSNSNGLRQRLLKEGFFERKCYNCSGVEWLGNPIPLELEHKNGNKFDNRIENLTLLCPNCHALTTTYRGKGKIGKYLKVPPKPRIRKSKPRPKLDIPISDEELAQLAQKYSALQVGLMFGLKEHATRSLLKRRNIPLPQKHPKKFDPNKEELANILNECRFNFCAVGRHYGVSDNAIRKRCKKLGVQY